MEIDYVGDYSTSYTMFYEYTKRWYVNQQVVINTNLYPDNWAYLTVGGKNYVPSQFIIGAGQTGRFYLVNMVTQGAVNIGQVYNPSASPSNSLVPDEDRGIQVYSPISGWLSAGQDKPWTNTDGYGDWGRNPYQVKLNFISGQTEKTFCVIEQKWGFDGTGQDSPTRNVWRPTGFRIAIPDATVWSDLQIIENAPDPNSPPAESLVNSGAGCIDIWAVLKENDVIS